VMSATIALALLDLGDLKGANGRSRGVLLVVWSLVISNLESHEEWTGDV